MLFEILRSGYIQKHMITNFIHPNLTYGHTHIKEFKGFLTESGVT